jgi:hypothetical protein
MPNISTRVKSFKSLKGSKNEISDTYNTLYAANDLSESGNILFMWCNEDEIPMNVAQLAINVSLDLYIERIDNDALTKVTNSST